MALTRPQRLGPSSRRDSRADQDQADQAGFGIGVGFAGRRGARALGGGEGVVAGLLGSYSNFLEPDGFRNEVTVTLGPTLRELG